MSELNTIAVIIASFGFFYLYIGEKQFIEKYVWLIVGICLIVFGLIGNSVLSSTVYSSNGLTTYTYTSDPIILALGQGLGVLLVILVGIFVYRVARSFI